jgi:hypothetical protein
MPAPPLHRLPAVALMMAGLAGAIPVQAHSFLAQEPDFLVASPAELRVRASAVRILAAPAELGKGERVAYTAFSGTTYELNRFRGRHVDLLLPDAWIEPGALSAEQIRAYVDRTDWIYQHLLDLVGAPPAGEGPLPVAIVPDTCGLGCGLLGAKGVEMKDVPEFRASFWQEIAEDIPSGVFVHELTHNFDLFSQYVAYAPDYAHAWTNFISYYYFAYAREGDLNAAPDEVIEDWLGVVGRYFMDPGADWATCVRDGRCGDRFITPELAWAGFGLKLALLDGPQAIRGFMAFLRQHRQSHVPAATPEEKNDLYIEALAAGARRDLSCVADAWRWPVSDVLRERMRRLYPTANPDCQDRDRDGFTPLEGDCDDRRATVRPGAAERLRRVDDDCDGRVDERVWSERAGGDFAAPPELTLPAEIVATAGGADVDTFFLHVPWPGRVSIELCSPDDGGFALFNEADTRREFLFVSDGICSQELFVLEPGTWRAEVFLGQTERTAYSVAMESGPPVAPAPWAKTAPPRRQGNRFVLTAVTALAPPLGPAEVRFWVSGHGIVGTVPYRRAASFTWQPPAGVDPVAEGLTYRAQLLARGAPAYTITRPQPFGAP